MSDRSSARRYAAALFDVAAKSGSAEAAGHQLATLSSVMGDHAELVRALETPAVPSDVKKNLVVAIARAAGALSAEVERLIALLANRDRLPLLPDVAAAYVARLNEEKKIVQEAANETRDYQRKVAREMDEKSREALVKNGMQINDISPEEIARMREKVKPVVEKYSAQVGEDLTKQFYAEIEKARAQR